MKTIFTILLLLTQLVVLAQETKKITEKIDRYEKYEYYVLKSDGKTKHGSFKKFDGKELETSGYYKNGKKDSLWIEYSYNGNYESVTNFSQDKKNGIFKKYDWNGSLSVKGSFENDQETGLWEYYQSNGDIQYKYDFSSNELIYFNPADHDLEYKKVEGDDTLVYTLDKPCIYLESAMGMYNHIGNTFRYPEDARNKNIQGKIYLNFTVTKEGKIENVKVLRGLGFGLDEEAIKAIESMPGKWSPAVLNGEKIDMQYNMPIVCKLN